MEKRVVDGKEVNVEIVDGKEVITPVKPDVPKQVSQEAIDRIWKQMKESEEKSEELATQLKESEEGKVDLVERIKKLETPEGEETTEPPAETYGVQSNGQWAFPQTEEEWDTLIAERPTFGMDLRNKYSEIVGGQTKKIQNAQLKSALKVANEILPDMYKKDNEGKVLLDKNGHPVQDEKSETFKIYCQIAAEEGVNEYGQPVIFSTKNGPELIALKTKQVLGTEREVELKKKAEAEKSDIEKKRTKQVQDGLVSPPGQEPPITTKAEVKFGSDYEKERAEQKVVQGVYKSLEEYCQIRDNKSVPYGRGGV